MATSMLQQAVNMLSTIARLIQYSNVVPQQVRSMPATEHLVQE